MSNPYRSRGGQYKTWLQNTQEVIKQNSTRNQATQPASPSGNEHEPEPEPAAVDDDMANIDPSLRGPPPSSPGTKKREYRKRKNTERYKREQRQRLRDGLEKEDESEGEEEHQVSTEDIQILDLHSKRPIFSYRGRIFEGQWAENVGTEMIFVEHDRDSAATLPVLRNLPGDVDLLAASASRILTKEKILKPKVEEADTLAPIQKEWNINIPKGAYKMSERAGQGNFLEKLMALKIKKGEKDHVTVYAKPADDGHFGQDGEKPRRRRRRKNNDGGEGDQGAPKRRRRPRGRPGTRGPRGRRARGAGPLHSDREEEERELSVPTPHRWADLEVPGPSGRESLAVRQPEAEDDDGSDDMESEDEEASIRRENDSQEDDEDDGDGNEDSSDEEEEEDEEAMSAAQTNTAMDVD